MIQPETRQNRALTNEFFCLEIVSSTTTATFSLGNEFSGKLGLTTMAPKESIIAKAAPPFKRKKRKIEHQKKPIGEKAHKPSVSEQPNTLP
jgi:hypothetical protein